MKIYTPQSFNFVKKIILNIKDKKKRLEYVGFSHDPSLAMQKYADLSILLSPRDIEKFKEKTLL